ncbi:MAG: hypothetical protein ACREDF_06500, partial [Thermoplasmata archaeon]
LRADSIASLAGRTDTIVRTLRVRIAVVDSLNPVPDTCLPNLAVRDSLIASQALEIAQWRELAGARAAMLALALGARDSLRDALASRPRPLIAGIGLSLPKIGLGAFAGVCGDGRACVGVGIVLRVLRI